MKKYIEVKYSVIPGIGLYAGIQKHSFGIDLLIFVPGIIIEITFKKQRS